MTCTLPRRVHRHLVHPSPMSPTVGVQHAVFEVPKTSKRLLPNASPTMDETSRKPKTEAPIIHGLRDDRLA